jgi:hypothetical protein
VGGRRWAIWAEAEGKARGPTRGQISVELYSSLPGLKGDGTEPERRRERNGIKSAQGCFLFSTQGEAGQGLTPGHMSSVQAHACADHGHL